VTCLFASGGMDLRAPLRDGTDDDVLRETIERVWTRRADRYSELRAGLAAGDGSAAETARGGVEVYEVGG